MTIRRVVTGHDALGKSVILSDGPPPQAAALRPPDCEFFELWNTREEPAIIRATEPCEPNQRQRTIGPEGHGSVLRVIDFQPQSQAREPRMHRTETIDYGLVLEGEIYLVLDASETLLRAGDIVIQRGTDHAWQNRSDRLCRMAFVLLAGRFDPALRDALPNLTLLP